MMEQFEKQIIGLIFNSAAGKCPIINSWGPFLLCFSHGLGEINGVSISLHQLNHQSWRFFCMITSNILTHLHSVSQKRVCFPLGCWDACWVDLVVCYSLARYIWVVLLQRETAAWKWMAIRIPWLLPDSRVFFGEWEVTGNFRGPPPLRDRVLRAWKTLSLFIKCSQSKPLFRRIPEAIQQLYMCCSVSVPFSSSLSWFGKQKFLTRFCLFHRHPA